MGFPLLFIAVVTAVPSADSKKERKSAADRFLQEAYNGCRFLSRPSARQPREPPGRETVYPLLIKEYVPFVFPLRNQECY
jgi:hypothetical protein